MSKARYFRVAVEGATATDGRVITADWINDIVATYNRQTYGARVNMEHIRGFSPQPPFNAYGDVLAVKKQVDDVVVDGKTEKRLALYAEIDPTDDLVKLTKARQKIYTSIEVAPNFANTGKAGLVGLAVTDSPASLATEILQFSATNEAVKNMLNARKQAPDNAFSAALETQLSFDDATDVAGEAERGVFAAISKMLNFGAAPSPQAAPQTPALAATPPQSQGGTPSDTGFSDAQRGQLGALFTALQSDLKADRQADRAAFNELKAEVTRLQGVIDNTEAHSGVRRPPATGGADAVLTDC